LYSYAKQPNTYVFFSVFLRFPTRYQHVLLKTGNLAHEPYPPAKEPDVWNIGVDPEDDWFDKNLPAATENPVFTALPIPEPDLRRVNPLGMRGSHTLSPQTYLLGTKNTQNYPSLWLCPGCRKNSFY